MGDRSGPNDEFQYIEIDGISHSGFEIWIPQLEIHSEIRAEQVHPSDILVLQGIANIFASARLPELDPTIGSYDCYLTLPDTPLFTTAADYHFDMPETPRPTYKETEETGIWWQTSFGRAELVRTYSYYSRRENVNRAFIEFRKCAVNVSIPVNLVSSWKEVITFLHNDFDDVLWLLSFLSKERVDWFDGFVTLTDESDRDLIVQLRRKARWSISPQKRLLERHELDLLVKVEVLANGGFARMVSALNNSPHRELFIRAIQYVMLTYEQFYAEAHIGLMYVAFEMLIDGLGEEYASIIEAEDFKQTEAELKRTLYAGTLEQALKDEIETKFRELRRRSLKRKAFLVFDKYSIDLKEVFPKNTNVKREFQLLLEGRNEFTHRGRIADYRKGFRDFRRLRYLVSILILKLLDYPLEQLNEHNEDGHLARRPLT